MKGVWEDDGVVVKDYVIYKADEYSTKGEFLYGLFSEGTPLSESVRIKANDYIMSLADRESFDTFLVEYSGYDGGGHTIRAYCVGDYYICVHTEWRGGRLANRYFNAKTFEELIISDLFADGWEREAVWTYDGHGVTESVPAPDYKNLMIESILGFDWYNRGNREYITINFWERENPQSAYYYKLTVPRKYLR
jgi:hypothetical protein